MAALNSVMTRSFMLSILLLAVSLNYPIAIAASDPASIYFHSVLEVPVNVEGLALKGFLRAFNYTLLTYLEGSLTRNHTFEGSIDLKFRKVVENNVLKANSTLDMVMANVSSKNLNFTLSVKAYCEAYEAEGKLVSKSLIEANYTDRGTLAKTLKLESLRIRISSNISSSISKNLSSLTVDSVVEPKSGSPPIDRLLTSIIANIINETLRDVKAEIEKIPGVTFEYKVKMDVDKAQVHITISLRRELPSPAPSLKLGGVEKEGVVNLKLKPGIVEFKANITTKTKKPLKGYFEKSLEISESKLRISLLVNKTLSKAYGLETAEILGSIMQAASAITALQEQLTLLTATTQGILKGMERTLANIEKGLPTQYQIITPTITINQTTTATMTEQKILETPKGEKREENIPLIMTLIGVLTLAVIAIAYRLLSRKALMSM